MKKWLSILLAATFVFTLVACNAGDTGEQESQTSQVEEGADKAVETPDEGTANVDAIQADQAFYAAADLSILKGKKIGITIQSLKNAYWAGVMQAMEDELKAAGAEYTIVACDDNSATQIGQIENFISSECDLIMVHPSDADAVESVCKDARDKGIKTMCWDDPMENTDGNWILNNTELGVAIGEMTADFINEKYSEDNKAQVVILDYPQTKVLLERGTGIEEGLKKAEGKYEIVAQQPALDPSQAQTAMETILQKSPDARVVTGIGAGPMIGANEALVTATGGKIPDDMGVFTTDVTKQQLEQLLDSNQASKGIIAFEGSDVDTAKACTAMYALILGEKLENKNIYRQTQVITPEKAQAVMDQMK